MKWLPSVGFVDELETFTVSITFGFDSNAQAAPYYAAQVLRVLHDHFKEYGLSDVHWLDANVDDSQPREISSAEERTVDIREANGSTPLSRTAHVDLGDGLYYCSRQKRLFLESEHQHDACNG